MSAYLLFLQYSEVSVLCVPSCRIKQPEDNAGKHGNVRKDRLENIVCIPLETDEDAVEQKRDEDI